MPGLPPPFFSSTKDSEQIDILADKLRKWNLIKRLQSNTKSLDPRWMKFPRRHILVFGSRQRDSENTCANSCASPFHHRAALPIQTGRDSSPSLSSKQGLVHGFFPLFMTANCSIKSGYEKKMYKLIMPIKNTAVICYCFKDFLMRLFSFISSLGSGWNLRTFFLVTWQMWLFLWLVTNQILKHNRYMLLNTDEKKNY